MTRGSGAATKRVYDDACGTALALEFLGERWSLLIVRELMYGPRRFGEIRSNLPGISANVLTQRLEALEAAGIVRRRHLPSPANVQAYDLTAWGREAEPVIQTMGRWAARSDRHDPMLFMSPASAMMSLGALIDAPRAGDLATTVGFRFPLDGFVATLDGGAMTIRRGDPDAADIVFTGDTMALRRTIYGKHPLSRDGGGGALKVAGDLAAAQAFVDLFALPDKAAG